MQFYINNFPYVTNDKGVKVWTSLIVTYVLIVFFIYSVSVNSPLATVFISKWKSCVWSLHTSHVLWYFKVFLSVIAVYFTLLGRHSRYNNSRFKGIPELITLPSHPKIADQQSFQEFFLISHISQISQITLIT